MKSSPASFDLLNFLAWGVAVATFPLIWVGGLVTTTNAGMAVPDWPGTFGYNLFLYPIEKWVQAPWDLFVEHGHRLFASGVGLLTIALCVVAWRSSKQLGVRWGSIGLLALVLLQGFLGGARVLFDERIVARIHGCVGPMFFLAAVAFAVCTSSWWTKNEKVANAGVRPLLNASLTMLAALIAQLILGAFMRHVAVSDSPALFRAVVYFHLLTAGMITIAAVVVGIRAAAETIPVHLRHTSWLLISLVVCQLALGVGSWVVRYSWPSWLGGFDFAAEHISTVHSLSGSLIRTAHVANGSALLAIVGYLTLHCWRLSPVTDPLRFSRHHWQGVAL